ncbi:MAG: O-antigen ligase family protein [Planctomycetota bacterium]
MIGLFLTFSKGGWLVGCVVLLGFIAVRGRGWLRRRWKACAAVVGAAAILVGAGLGLSAGLRGRLAAMRHEFGASARVRWQYWSAAVSMWRASPVVGVGPGNFKHHYLRHKAVAAEETKHAHNDYVQLLAEAGPAAAAAYGLFWALLLAGAWRRTGRGARLPPRRDGRADGGEIGPRGVPRGLLPAAGLAGIVLAELVAAPLSISESRGLNILALAVFAALWWAGYAATGLVPPDERSRRAVRLGLTLGLFGFVLHSFLDLDLYVAGVGATAFALAGLVAAPWAGRRDVNLRAGARLAVLVVVTVLSLGVLFVVSRISAARTECRQGEIALGRAVRLAAGRASSPGDRTARLPAAARRAEVRQLLLQAEQFFDRAARINPMDFRAYRGLAECRELRLSAGATRDRFASAVAAWRDAIRLNPSVGEFHWRLGRLFADHARRFRRLIRERYAPEYEAVPADGALPSPVPALYRPAVVELARATALAPTSPRMRIRYGRVLTQAGLGAAAAEQFRAALDLNDRMVAGHAPARQRLTEEELGRVQTELELIGFDSSDRMED